MFSKSTFALFAILTAAANAAPGYPGGSSQQCSSSVKSCCESVQHTKDVDHKKLELFGLLGIVANVAGYIALDCSPILSGGCKAQTVCCQNNHSYGLINIGCTPIDIL